MKTFTLSDLQRTEPYRYRWLNNMTLKQFLELVALVVQIISFPIAAWSLYWARKEAKASRDLQIALNLSESFRSRWEGGWSDALYELKQIQRSSNNAEVPEKYRDPLFQMLNWIDWLGVLIRRKSLSDKKIIFESIGPQFVEIIEISRPLLKPYFEEHGPDYWAGLVTVAEALNVQGLDALGRLDARDPQARSD